MTGNRIAAVAAILALAAGCDDGRTNSRKPALPAAAVAAGTVKCPDITAAPAPDEIRRNTTLINQPMKVPTPPPALQVVVTVKCFDADFLIPRHKHPWQRYVYIDGGSVVVTFEDTLPQQISFKAGELIVESIDTWHTAQVDGPAKLIVIDQVPTTNPPTNNQINPPAR